MFVKHLKNLYIRKKKRMKDVIEKLLQVVEYSTKEAEKTDDAKRKKELLSVVRCIEKVNYRLGHKKPRKKKVNGGLPPKDAFKKKSDVEPKVIDNNAPKDAFKYKDPIQSKQEVKEIDNPFKESENVAKGPKWNKRLSKDKKQAILKLHAERKTIAEISNELWIDERAIAKALNLGQNNNKSIIADNATKDIKKEFE